MLKDLPTDKIHARDDARDLNPANVEALASSIADIGLINPIRVRPDSDGWEVIAGRHRLEAHRSLGLAEITCDEVEDDEDHAETAMIDENVIREELSPVDRAIYLARRKELYLVKHPTIRANQHTGARNSQELGTPERFTAHVARVTGQSEATVQQAVKQGTDVTPEVLNMVRGTPLDQVTYLNRLVGLSPNDQFRAAERDLATERDKARQSSAETQAAALAARAKQRAIKTAAELITTYVPKKDMDALVSALMAAGKASDIAKEIEMIR